MHCGGGTVILTLTPQEERWILSRRSKAFVRPGKEAITGEILKIAGREFEIIAVTKHRLGFIRDALSQDLGFDEGEDFRHW